MIQNKNLDSGFRKIEISKSDEKNLEKIINNSNIILKNGVWVSSAGLRLNYWLATEKLISEPQLLKSIAKNLKKIIASQKIQVIAACSIASIPWATTISNMYDLPLVILRKRKESHGEQAWIIGNIKLIARGEILLVDDSILSGKTIRSFYNRTKRLGYKLKHVFVFDVWSNRKMKNEIENWAKTNNIIIWFVKDFELKLNE